MSKFRLIPLDRITYKHCFHVMSIEVWVKQGIISKKSLSQVSYCRSQSIRRLKLKAVNAPFAKCELRKKYISSNSSQGCSYRRIHVKRIFILEYRIYIQCNVHCNNLPLSLTVREKHPDMKLITLQVMLSPQQTLRPWMCELIPWRKERRERESIR